MYQFENFIAGVDMSDPPPTRKEIEEIVGEKIIPYTVMRAPHHKGFVIFMPGDEIHHLSPDAIAYLKAQLNTIR